MSIIDGPEYTIPLSYCLEMKSLKLIDIRACHNNQFSINYDEEKTIDIIDCGEKDFNKEKKIKLILYNPGNIRLPYSIKTTNKKIFALSTENGYINGKEYININLIFKEYNFDENEEIPQKIECDDNLLVTFNNNKDLPYLSIPLKGVLVDNAEQISFPKPIEFPLTFNETSSYKILEWRNPVRRPINYRLSISNEFSDIFKVAESKFSNDFINEIEVY